MTPRDQELSGAAVAAIVRDHMDPILQRWQQRVLREVYAAGNQEQPSLVDSMPAFIEQLALTVEAPSLPRQQAQTTRAAREHGGERARVPGYTLDQVIFEYQVLREVMVETLEAQQHIGPQALRRIHAVVDHAIREASVHFVERARERPGHAERSTRLQEALLTAARAQAEVEAVKTRLANLIQNAPVFICAQEGPQHVYQLANPLYQQLVGPGRPLLGLTVREALPEVVEQGFADVLDRVYSTGEPFIGSERPVQLQRQEGGPLEQTLLNFVYQPRRDAWGQVEGIDTFGFDVTELVRARQRAELLSSQMADRADFEQQLIGIVSHDLRNPLSAILLGSSLLMRREGLDARTTQSLVRIQASAERATRMVNDLLDFTQARLGGGLRMERRPADLHQVTRGVVEEVEITWPTRTLEVRHEGDGQGEWDSDRMAQAVQNLVTNALKYSPEDSPVSITTRGQDAEVILSVTNQGPPIPSDKRMGLFEPMQRATEELDKAGRSVGLGLYIVKNIVEAHGGQVDVVSTLEEGTRFTVHLPRHGRPPQ